MKRFIGSLKLGESVVAEVLESTGRQYFIVNFKGDLIRIANCSDQNLIPGQKVHLIVTGINPLAFRLGRFNRFSLDRRV